MNRQAEDEELDKLLEEELIWEAEMIERGLLSDNEIEERRMTQAEIDASFDKLVERLKADGIYHEDKEIHDTPVEKTGRKIFFISGWKGGKSGRSVKKIGFAKKVAGCVLVCFLSMLGASMSVEGNRQYFIDKIDYLTGNDTKIYIDNDMEEEINEEQDEQDEQKAIDIIESQLGIEMPIFRYRPHSFEFYEFEVDKTYKRAITEYRYQDIIMTLFVDGNTDYSKKSNYFLEGQQVDSVSSDHGEIQVTIMELQDINDDSPNYAATWIKDSVFYQLSGKMEREEFIKLIEKMQF